MSNVPGLPSNATPGVYDTVSTISSGVAVPGGARITAMIGQGTTNETLVSQAKGGGQDGLDPTFTTQTGSDGRHFQLANFPLIANRTTVFLNGVPLTGFELGPITTTTTFSSNYQYQLDPVLGRLLLQPASLQDQGGTFYVPLSTNVGLGTLNNLTLLDQNDPPEVWTIRCVSVQRNAMSQPIAGTASFLAFGSVSGSPLDANGNPIIWISDGYVVSNTILSFSITETSVGGVTTSPFVPGDGFTIIVDSGVLVLGQSLTTNEIPVANINNPTLTQGITDIFNLAGFPSLTNNLALGGQLFYANSASSMIALQAAPPLPRRTSYILAPTPPGVNSLSLNPEDFIFPFPLGVVPDTNSQIHVFLTNLATGIETQVLPNQYPFYTLTSSSIPTVDEFIFSNFQPPAGNSFSYSIINSFDEVATGFDGYIARLPAFRNQAIFSSASVSFDLTYVGNVLEIVDSENSANIGSFLITGVSNGQLTIKTITSGTLDEPGQPGVDAFTTPLGLPDFISENGTSFGFEVIYIPTGLAVAGGSGTDATLVAFLNTSTATLHSATQVNFENIGNAATLEADYRIKITDSSPTIPNPAGNAGPNNDGLYDIIGYNQGTNTLTIAMAFVSEDDLRYEVINPETSAQTTYLVLNHNVVPNPGYQLRVTIVDARDAPFYDAGWIEALAALQTVECDIVVPLPNQTISVIFQNALNHCITMSNVQNRKERVLFIGAIQQLTPANLIGTALADVEDLGIIEGIPDNDITSTLAANIQDIANYSVPNAYGDTFRCVYFYPDQIVVQASGNNILVDGFYLAAAGAGFCNADLALQDPLTNKVLSGFTILNTKTYSPLTIQQLGAAGVCVLQPVAGGGRIVWGITTSQSGFPEEQEISIVFIRDRVAKVLRAGFGGFIGTAETTNTATAMNTEAVILLNSLITQGLITAYRGLTVVKDSVDPRQWDISVEVQPVYPINWVYIQISIGNLGA